MTFEKWVEEMKKGLSLSLQSDEKPKGFNWSYDRLDGEIEEEKPKYDPSQNY